MTIKLFNFEAENTHYTVRKCGKKHLIATENKQLDKMIQDYKDQNRINLNV